MCACVWCELRTPKLSKKKQEILCTNCFCNVLNVNKINICKFFICPRVCVCWVSLWSVCMCVCVCLLDIHVCVCRQIGCLRGCCCCSSSLARLPPGKESVSLTTWVMCGKCKCASRWHMLHFFPSFFHCFSVYFPLFFYCFSVIKYALLYMIKIIALITV